ncbi:SDR family NAD(P)-dependent oxidoreductase [Streptomyces alkaliphilus]|uniref:SDR family NAD(P)-dependent oxidoreductase n=1 Tax=Streptomyces alkaliphilus TaxID=1472722 RepID=UPI0034D37B03
MRTSEKETVVVTGGARGIGAATARLLVERGCAVVIADVLDDEAARLAEELGPPAEHHHLDVTEPGQWERVFRETARTRGPITGLVNNAGILAIGSIEEQTPEEFRRVWEVNLLGAWLGMRAALPHLRRAGGGAVVNVSSTAGLMGYADLGAYVASKWALRGLTKTAALEFARDGVRVCSLHPGPIDTPMTAGMDDSVVAGQPLPRFGTPREPAAMIVFLLREATFSTGSEFVADGGATTGSTVISELDRD